MKVWKHIAGMLLAVCMMLEWGTASAERNAVEGEKALQAVKNMKIGWNLGNTLDSTGDWILAYTEGTAKDFETAWGNPVTDAPLMRKVKRLGFNAIRIPITWKFHFNDQGIIDEAWLSRVQEIVDMALDAHLYCIINIHHDTGSDGWLRASKDNYKKNAALFASLWTQIAQRFRDYPETLLFEGFNEMLDDNAEWSYPTKEGLDTVNAYNQLFVDTVRATGGRNATRNLVVCTYAASNVENILQGFQMPHDMYPYHLIAEVHFYTPYEFAGYEDWTMPYNSYTEDSRKAVDDAFTLLKRKFGGTPLIIGEFAASNKNNTADRIQWYTRVVQDAKRIGAVCFIWDNGDGGDIMGLINRTGKQDVFPDIIKACTEAAGTGR